MTVGDRIRARRDSLEISQTDLAAKAGIKKQTLYKYEMNMITNIPSDAIERLADILHVSPSYLMGWENSLSKENADLIPDVLSDLDLVNHIKKITLLNKEHKQTIYDNIDYWYDKEVH